MKILIAAPKPFPTTYENAITHAGATPVVSLSYLDAVYCDALVLPGGTDIDPLFYGETNQGSRNIDLELDEKQFTLLEYFVSKKKPILGICKGMQLINVYFGGNLYQDMEEAHSHEYKGADQIHNTYTVNNSFLSALYGSHLTVNSAHHQSVKKLAYTLTPIQYAMDGVLEGFAHKSLPIIGVQWHPERMSYEYVREDTVNGSSLFQYFLSIIPQS